MFLVLGILILIVIVFGLYQPYEGVKQRTADAESSLTLTSFGSDVEQYVQTCLERTAKSALAGIGRHGGYFMLPDRSNPELSLPYFLVEDQDFMLSQDELERQLRMAVSENFKPCLAGFEQFKKRGYAIVAGTPSATSQLNEKSARVTLHLPLTIEQKGTSRQFSDFTVLIPSRLGLIHSLVSELIAADQENPAGICVSCLVLLNTEHQLQVQTATVENGDVAFVVLDPIVPVNNKPYVFAFVNRYKAGEPREE